MASMTISICSNIHGGDYLHEDCKSIAKQAQTEQLQTKSSKKLNKSETMYNPLDQNQER